MYKRTLGKFINNYATEYKLLITVVKKKKWNDAYLSHEGIKDIRK